MNQLLQTIWSWTTYLERPTVVLQLLVVVLPPLAVWILGRRRRLRRLPLLVLAPIGLGVALIALSGEPIGLALVLTGLGLGWWGINLLHVLLRPVIAPRSLELFETRLLRPAYVVFSAVVLIGLVANLQDLAVIPVAEWFGTAVNLGDLVVASLSVYLLVIGSGPPADGLAWLVQETVGMGDGSRRALALMIRYVVVGLGILWALDHVGFNPTAILAIAGGLSVGLGFGIKEVFSNFISGLWLLFEGSVRPGEVLFIDGDPCEVRSLGLRAAVLWRDRDNAELVIPNQTFFTMTTTTYTGTDRMRRSQVLVGAAYRHNPDAVVALLEQTALATPRVLHHPAPKGLVLSYGDSSVQYALRFWIENPMDNVTICSEVNQAIWKAFAEQGIEIPYPQRVLHQA
jgi:small-conductance mechanosensitive channel